MLTSLVVALTLQGVYFSQFFEDISQHVGPDLVQHQLRFQGQQVDFQHQHWGIRYDSICRQHKISEVTRNKCRQAAQQFFIDACDTLSEQKFGNEKYAKPHKMFCDAAVHYKANQVKEVADAQTELLKNSCQALVKASIDSHDRKLLEQRDEVCSEYRRNTVQ